MNETEILNQLKELLPLLIPLIIIQLILIIAALVDLVKRPSTALNGPKWVWVLAIFFVNFIGPIIYFVAGRKDE